jgi:hypothetical protein
MQPIGIGLLAEMYIFGIRRHTVRSRKSGVHTGATEEPESRQISLSRSRFTISTTVSRVDWRPKESRCSHIVHRCLRFGVLKFRT